MKPRHLIVPALLSLALVSCASLEVPAPASSSSTLLVLPFVVDNRSERSGPLGFNYTYRIESIDHSTQPLTVVFKRKMPGDMLLVDSLAPGKYHLTRVGIFPAGSGDHSYAVNSYDVDQRFELAAGSITVFPISLNIDIYNSTPGRGNSTTYGRSLEPVNSAQRAEIVKTLRESPNFDSWKLIL